MIVIFRDKYLGKVVTEKSGAISFKDEHGDIVSTGLYNDDLTYPGDCDSDIVEVYNLPDDAYYYDIFRTDKREKLWTRENIY